MCHVSSWSIVFILPNIYIQLSVYFGSNNGGKVECYWDARMLGCCDARMQGCWDAGMKGK